MFHYYTPESEYNKMSLREMHVEQNKILRSISEVNGVTGVNGVTKKKSFGRRLHLLALQRRYDILTGLIHMRLKVFQEIREFSYRPPAAKNSVSGFEYNEALRRYETQIKSF